MSLNHECDDCGTDRNVETCLCPKCLEDRLEEAREEGREEEKVEARKEAEKEASL